MDLTRLASIKRSRALDGMISFVEHTKPYHTQILDVEIELTHQEQMSVQLVDTHLIDVEITQNNIPLTHICSGGYGITWDSDSVDSQELYPTTDILHACAYESLAVVPDTFYGGSPSTTTILCVLDSVANLLNLLDVGDVYVTFATTGTLPVTSPQIMVGVQYKIEQFISSSPEGGFPSVVLSIDNTIITWEGVMYDGPHPLSIIPDNVNINSFIITSSLGSIYEVQVTNIASNVLTFTTPYPKWPQGTKITLSSTGILPSPLDATLNYFVQPVEGTDGIRLSTVRYPTQQSHYVNITNGGEGTHTIQKAETFFEGQNVTVTGSYNWYNNNNYNVQRTVRLSPTTEQVFVLGKILNTTPPEREIDGQIAAIPNGFSEQTYCTPATMNNMHVEANMSERITFDFTYE